MSKFLDVLAQCIRGTALALFCAWVVAAILGFAFCVITILSGFNPVAVVKIEACGVALAAVLYWVLYWAFAREI